MARHGESFRAQLVSSHQMVDLDADQLAADEHGKRETRPIIGKPRPERNAAPVVPHPGEAVDQGHPGPPDRCDGRRLIS